VGGGQVSVAFDLTKHQDKLLAFEVGMDPGRRFLQGARQVERVPWVLSLTTTPAGIRKEVQVPRLNLAGLAQNDRALDVVLELSDVAPRGTRRQRR